MSTMHRLFDWVEANRDVAFDLVRVYLGLGLFVRGWLFVSDTSRLVGLVSMDAGTEAFVSGGMAHYVALAHLGGGLLLALGLLTRIAALVQIPVLIGAVFFVHLNEGLLAAGQSLEFSALVLFLLAVIFFHGAGRLSLDYYIFEREQDQAVRAAERSLHRPEAPPVPGSEPARAESVVPAGCTCGLTRDRSHPRVEAERRYGMRALRFLTGTTGTPREILFRCRDCGHIVERSESAEDIAYYRYF